MAPPTVPGMTPVPTPGPPTHTAVSTPSVPLAPLPPSYSSVQEVPPQVQPHSDGLYDTLAGVDPTRSFFPPPPPPPPTEAAQLPPPPPPPQGSLFDYLNIMMFM